MLRVDVHQHIWTEPLLARLGARQTLPLVRHSNGLTVLHSVAEQPYVIDVASEAPEQRATLVRRDGLDLALIAISSPIGIEALPYESAVELIDAHLDGVAALPGESGPGALPRRTPTSIRSIVCSRADASGSPFPPGHS